MADTRVEDLDEGTSGLELVGLSDGDLADVEARGVVRDGSALGLGDLLLAGNGHCVLLLLGGSGVKRARVVERAESLS